MNLDFWDEVLIAFIIVVSAGVIWVYTDAIVVIMFLSGVASILLIESMITPIVSGIRKRINKKIEDIRDIRDLDEKSKPRI